MFAPTLKILAMTLEHYIFGTIRKGNVKVCITNETSRALCSTNLPIRVTSHSYMQMFMFHLLMVSIDTIGLDSSDGIPEATCSHPALVILFLFKVKMKLSLISLKLKPNCRIY